MNPVIVAIDAGHIARHVGMGEGEPDATMRCKLCDVHWPCAAIMAAREANRGLWAQQASEGRTEAPRPLPGAPRLGQPVDIGPGTP